MWVVFFFTIVYSMLGQILIYFFEEKRRSLHIDFTEDIEELTEVEISQHSVLIRGLNKNIPLENARLGVSALRENLFENDILSFHVVGDYEDTLNDLRKLENAYNKRNHYLRLFNE